MGTKIGAITKITATGHLRARPGGGRYASRRRRMRAVALAGATALLLSTVAIAGPSASAATTATIAIGDVTVAEGNSGITTARATVRLSTPVATTTIVRFATGGGTATAGTDYRSQSSKVRIRAGATGAVLAVSVLGDTAAEAAETVNLRLSGSGGLPITDPTGTVTIRDDETVAGVTIGDAQIWEGHARTGLAKLTVVLDAAVATDTVVSYTTANGTARAPGDYRARTGRVRIRAGRTVATITATAAGDTTLEPDETFQVVLTSTGSSRVALADRIGLVTIRNDEPNPVEVPTTPAAPTGLTVVPGPQPRHLTADWQTPVSSTPLTGYDVEVTRGATTNVVANVTRPFAFGCGLASVTDTCTVRARARNAAGDGPWSTPVSASTWAPPAAPPNLTVLSGGGAVTWDAPDSDQPINHYEVQKQTTGSTSWTHVTTTTSTQAATACSSCSVRVSAYSDVGFGPFATVAIALPGAPSDLTATRDLDNHELVHLVWSPPANPGSHPITSYDILVNGFALPSTHGTTTDVLLRSTIIWNVEVYANTLVGRSVFPALVTLLPG